MKLRMRLQKEVGLILNPNQVLVVLPPFPPNRGKCMYLLIENLDVGSAETGWTEVEL